MDELEQPAEQLDSGAAAAAAEDHDQAAHNHDSQADEVSQEDAEEDEEVEIGDKKFALPKSAAEKLKAERLMQADYTRKTQEVAETRKQIEAEREQVKQSAAQQQQLIKEVAAVHSLDAQLEQFKTFDWMAASTEDPVGTQQLQIRFQQLQQQRNEAHAAVTQKQNEHALNEQRALATQVQEAEAYVQREIPGWNDERATKVTAYAASQGLKVDQGLAKVLVQHPALFKILHQAEMFGQLEKKQTTKPQAPAAPPAPVTRVGATRATAKPDPAKMTDAQWYAAEQERRRKR